MAGAFAKVFKHLGRVDGQVSQVASLHRFHDHDRLPVFTTNLVALAALDPGIVVVHIVELDLNYLYVRIFRKDLIKDFRLVVERKPDMADFSFRLELERGLVSPAGLERLVILTVLRMHQVEVEVVHSTGLKL